MAVANKTFLAAALIAMFVAAPAHAQIKSFPQAEGFGAAALGGRGGDVYHVMNLTDSGVGSLRYGLENAPAAGRTIVFDVGGWITLNDKLGLTKSRVTIAGQTAPGGIGIRNGQFSVGGDDVVVRHMRFRPGKITNTDHDSVNTNENAQRVIYDHISAEFSTDGGFDLQADLLTLQYSSVSFGLLTHSTGGLIQSPTGGAAGELSFHHNMFAHNQTRNPKARAELIDWRDNVIYNFHDGFIAGDSDTNVNPNWKANFDGNTYISNVGGNSGGGGRPMMTGGDTVNYDLWYGVNALDRDSDSAADPIVYTQAQAMANQSIVSSGYNWSATSFPAADVWQSGSPAAAYTRVLQEFGATPWTRDAVDQLIATQVPTRTGQRISNENSLGIANAGYPTLGGVPAPLDSDGDGMPNTWEEKYGLSTTTASNNGDFDNDGFTNLEEYLNDLAAFKAIGPLEFNGTGRYADWANWSRRWQPSRFDDVVIHAGTATVDALGQQAGSILLVSTASNFPRLQVTAGRLTVTEEIVIGTNSLGGELTLSGGVLEAESLIKGAGGGFHFTGGVLHAREVHFPLVNNGGTLAPGRSIGTTMVDGDLTLASGVLEIEIGGRDFGEFDRVEVSGVAHLGGTLRVQLVDLGGGAYVPKSGDVVPFLSSAGTSGAFAAFDLPPLPAGLAWAIAPGNVATFLAVVGAWSGNPADFNHDGKVDGADLTRWRAGVGASGHLDNALGDADGDHDVDGADLLVWQRQLGSSTPNSAVPEPAGIVISLGGLLLAARGPRNYVKHF